MLHHAQQLQCTSTPVSPSEVECRSSMSWWQPRFAAAGSRSIARAECVATTPDFRWVLYGTAEADEAKGRERERARARDRLRLRACVCVAFFRAPLWLSPSPRPWRMRLRTCMVNARRARVRRWLRQRRGHCRLCLFLARACSLVFLSLRLSRLPLPRLSPVPRPRQRHCRCCLECALRLSSPRLRFRVSSALLCVCASFPLPRRLSPSPEGLRCSTSDNPAASLFASQQLPFAGARGRCCCPFP